MYVQESIASPCLDTVMGFWIFRNCFLKQKSVFRLLNINDPTGRHGDFRGSYKAELQVFAPGNNSNVCSSFPTACKFCICFISLLTLVKIYKMTELVKGGLSTSVGFVSYMSLRKLLLTRSSGWI